MLEALESPEPMRVSWGRLESGSSCCAVLQSQKWFLRGSFHWWFWPKRPNICDCGWDTRFLIPILWHRHGCHGISQISPYFSHFWAQNGFQVPRISRNAMKMPKMPGGPTLRELLSWWAALGSNHRCCRRSPRTSQRFRWRSGGDWQQRILLQFHQQRKWHYARKTWAAFLRSEFLLERWIFECFCLSLLKDLRNRAILTKLPFCHCLPSHRIYVATISG